MNLSLPERERLAYVLGLPVAKLLAQLADLDGSQHDTLRHEVYMLTQEIGELKEAIEDTRLEKDFEELYQQVETQRQQLSLTAALCSDIPWADS